MRVLANVQKQLELLNKKRIVIIQVEAKEWKRFDERAAFGDGGAHSQKTDDRDEGYDHRQGQTAWSHQEVKADNVHEDGREQGEGQGNVAVEQEENGRDDFEDKDPDEIVGDKEAPNATF